MDSTLRETLAKAFADELSSQGIATTGSVTDRFTILLDRYADLVTAMVAAVPLLRFARELAVAALTEDNERLLAFLQEHCPPVLHQAVDSVGGRFAWDVTALGIVVPEPFRRIRKRAAGLQSFQMARRSPFRTDEGRMDDYITVDVFFATDRERTTGTSGTESYGTERGTMSWGRAGVTIPRDHRMGKLEEPHWWRLEFRRDARKHVTVSRVQDLGEHQFFTEVGQCPEAGNQALVFVHGYNVSFDEALRRTGQLAYDLNFAGVPILYSWPSNGNLAHYGPDAANAEWTRPHLSRFLAALTARSGFERIHLVAHSMGGRAVLDALERLAGEETPQTVFHEVAFAAPDEDRDIFRDVLGRVRPLAQRMTLYASGNDLAMAASRLVNGHPRAGDSLDGVLVMRGLDTIDASAVDTSFIGHGYYGDNRSVLSDLYYLLQGHPPDARHGLRKQRDGDLVYWTFTG